MSDVAIAPTLGVFERWLTLWVALCILAVPIVIQVHFNADAAYLLNHRLGVAHCAAAPSALIGASNFFE